MSITIDDKNPKDEDKKSKETATETKAVPASEVPSAESKAPVTEKPKPATPEVVEDKPAEVGGKETVAVKPKPEKVDPAKKAFADAKKSMYVKQFDGVGPGASLAVQYAFAEEYAREMVASGAWVVDTTAYNGKTIQFLFKAKK